MEAKATRKPEFAKFFDLFERLTNRALRKNQAQGKAAVADAIKPLEVPADLASPAIRNLSTIASSNDARKQKGKPRNSDGEVAQQFTEETVNNFPAGKSYPFTFKMMLHKLYELEEWGRKVKELLEKSRENYKSLADVDWKKRKSQDESQRDDFRPETKQVKKSAKGHPSTSHARSDSSPTNAAAGRVSFRSSHVKAAPKSPRKGEGRKFFGKGGERVPKKHCARKKATSPVEGKCELGNTRTYSASLEKDNYSADGKRSKDNKEDSFSPPSTSNEIEYCTVVRRKRALSEADISNPPFLPCKRPYVL